MRSIAGFIYFKMMGWKLSGKFPDLKKCVIIIIPHTSWWDFVLGLLVREIIGKKSILSQKTAFVYKGVVGKVPANSF